MSMINKFTNWVSESSANLKSEVMKYKNKNFLEATMAGCAMVASADGIISSDEKRKMIGFIEQNDALKVFKMEEAIKIFESFATKINFDKEIGRGECLKSIIKLKDKPEARLMIRACCAVGASDGDFDDDEKQVVREMCRELELKASDFNL